MQKFTMTQSQMDKILEACKPVLMIALQCGTPASPQKNANRAWENLGKELGFKFMTVKPIPGDKLSFMAEPTTPTT